MKKQMHDVCMLSDAALEVVDDVLNHAINRLAKGWSVLPWCLLVILSDPYALEVEEREQKVEYDFWLAESGIEDYLPTEPGRWP